MFKPIITEKQTLVLVIGLEDLANDQDQRTLQQVMAQMAHGVWKTEEVEIYIFSTS